MNFIGLNGNIVYYQNTDVSTIHGAIEVARESYKKHSGSSNIRNIYVNGVKHVQTHLICVSGVVNKVEYEIVSYERISTLDGNEIASTELELFKANFIKDKIEVLTKDLGEDVHSEHDLYHAYYNIANNFFNQVHQVGYVNKEHIELIDITDLFTKHVLVDVDYNKLIDVYLASPLADNKLSLNKGIYVISGISIYNDTVRNMCEKFGLKYEKGYSYTSDKINGQYFLKDDKYNFGVYQFNTYENAVQNVERIKKYFEDILMVGVDKYFSNTTKLNIIYTLETIRNSVQGLDTKINARDSKYVVIKQFNNLIEELRQSSYKNDVDENKLVEIILKKS